MKSANCTKREVKRLVRSMPRAKKSKISNFKFNRNREKWKYLNIESLLLAPIIPWSAKIQSTMFTTRATKQIPKQEKPKSTSPRSTEKWCTSRRTPQKGE